MGCKGSYARQNAVTLRYTLTEHWLLEVVSGLTQTADLLYQLER